MIYDFSFFFFRVGEWGGSKPWSSLSYLVGFPFAMVPRSKVYLSRSGVVPRIGTRRLEGRVSLSESATVSHVFSQRL